MMQKGNSGMNMQIKIFVGIITITLFIFILALLFFHTIYERSNKEFVNFTDIIEHGEVGNLRLTIYGRNANDWRINIQYGEGIDTINSSFWICMDG